MVNDGGMSVMKIEHLRSEYLPCGDHFVFPDKRGLITLEDVREHN